MNSRTGERRGRKVPDHKKDWGFNLTIKEKFSRIKLGKTGNWQYCLNGLTLIHLQGPSYSGRKLISGKNNLIYKMEDGEDVFSEKIVGPQNKKLS